MFKVLDKECEPKKGTEFSACIDLFSAEDVVIGAGETVLVGLGVVIDKERLAYNAGIASDGHKHFYRTHQLNLHIRSSMSDKHGLIIANGTGIIDLDYEDEIKICLHNPISHTDISKYVVDNDIGTLYSKRFVDIKKGQKIAQISLVEHKSYLFGVDSEEKRDGGFGSTDNKEDTHISSMLDDD